MKDIRTILEKGNYNPRFKRVLDQLSKELSKKDFDSYIQNISKLFLRCKLRK